MRCDWATGDWRHRARRGSGARASLQSPVAQSLHSHNEMLRERIKRGILQGCTKYS